MTLDPNNTRRFGIGEWYGRSFTDLSDDERLALARFKADKKTRLSKAERDRLTALEEKAASPSPLKTAEAKRLYDLRRKKEREQASNQVCPFKGLSVDAICTKDGGVCSLRLYEKRGDIAIPIQDERGGLRALCPSRFHERNTVFQWAGESILGDSNPHLVGEVGFLESSGTIDGSEGEDVGRIDMVLVKRNLPADHPMQWCALEIQAVYFSGPEMKVEFDSIAQAGGARLFPIKLRRPDYRSSGPKRLMPQLQIKVPPLRRWGKKMVVVVDTAFFESMGPMESVPEISNADIAWLLVDFVKSADENRFELTVSRTVYTTLERAIEGLTGGTPVPLQTFEQRITEKLSSRS